MELYVCGDIKYKQAFAEHAIQFLQDAEPMVFKETDSANTLDAQYSVEVFLALTDGLKQQGHQINPEAMFKARTAIEQGTMRLRNAQAFIDLAYDLIILSHLHDSDFISEVMKQAAGADLPAELYFDTALPDSLDFPAVLANLNRVFQIDESTALVAEPYFTQEILRTVGDLVRYVNIIYSSMERQALAQDAVFGNIAECMQINVSDFSPESRLEQGMGMDKGANTGIYELIDMLEETLKIDIGFNKPETVQDLIDMCRMSLLETDRILYEILPVITRSLSERQVLWETDLMPEASLAELGVDSCDIVNIRLDLTEWLGSGLAGEGATAEATLIDVAKFIQRSCPTIALAGRRGGLRGECKEVQQ